MWQFVEFMSAIGVECSRFLRRIDNNYIGRYTCRYETNNVHKRNLAKIRAYLHTHNSYRATVSELLMPIVDQRYWPSFRVFIALRQADPNALRISTIRSIRLCRQPGEKWVFRRFLGSTLTHYFDTNFK